MRHAASIAGLLGVVLLFSGCSKEEPAPEPLGEPETLVRTEPELDPVTGLKMTGDWEIVRANCMACHSGKLITQQRGSAQQWLTMIRWMQKKQNLWPIPAEQEQVIIEYLATHYAETDWGRRPNLAISLMP